MSFLPETKTPKMETEFFHIYVPNENRLTKIAVYHWFPLGERADTQTPVICAHGLTRTGRDFDPLATSLAQNGRHVFCVDFPGRGLSDDLSDAKNYNYGTYQNMMMHLIMHACQKTGAKKPEIQGIGTSMGGMLLSNVAAMDEVVLQAFVGAMIETLDKAPLQGAEKDLALSMKADLQEFFGAKELKNPVKTFVCNDVGGEYNRAGLARIAGYIKEFPTFETKMAAKDFLMSIYKGAGSWGPMTEDEKFDLASKSLRATQDGKYTFGYDPRIVETFDVPEKNVPLWAVWEKITCPVLLFRGEDSDLLSQETAEKMRDYHAIYGKGPKDVHLMVAPETGHAPALFLQEQKDAIVLFTNDKAAFEKNMTPDILLKKSMGFR